MIHQRLAPVHAGIFLAVALITGSLFISSCGRLSSVFYNQKNPQAIQRDTIRPSGTQTSWLDYADQKANGVIQLAPVEFIQGMDSVAVQVPSALKAQGGVFETDRKLYAPSGFSAEVFAWDLGMPTDLLVRDDGTVFYTDHGAGEVGALSPSGEKTIIMNDLNQPHGLELHDGALYVVTEHSVYKYEFASPTSVEGTEEILTEKLPDAGDFRTRTIRYRPSDDKFYISVPASTFNGEDKERSYATLFQLDPDGRLTRWFINGLHNTTGLDVHPETGELWGIDQGMDDLAVQLAPEEINILKSGGRYGHPYYYSQNFRNPKYADLAEGDVRLPKNPTAPVIELQSHSYPTDLHFYEHDVLGPRYKNSMLIVFRGYYVGSAPWPEENRTGFKIIRLRSDKDGGNARQADFISGWLRPNNDYWGLPYGISWTPDGKTFYVTDQRNGLIYRFTAP